MGTPPFLPGASSTLDITEKLKKSMENPQIQQILGALAQAKGGGAPPGGGGGAAAPASQGPGTVAGLPGQGTGQYPIPTPTPPRGPRMSGPDPIAQSKLDPHAAGVYSGIQGISQLMQSYEQRQDQKQHTEAENVAKRLMTAMDATNSTDEKTRMNAMVEINDIMNDPKQKKVLDKVYKGWLEAAKPDEVDPGQAGFEKAIKDFVTNKQMPQQPLQMPRTVGGMVMPQATPAQQMQNLIQQQQMRYLQQHPEAAGMTPEQYKLEAEQVKLQIEQQKGVIEMQKAQNEADVKAAELQIKQQEILLEKQRTETEGKKGDIETLKGKFDVEKYRTELDTARQNSLRASYEADAARYKAEYSKLHPAGAQATKTPTANDLRKPDLADSVVRKLDNVVNNKQILSAQDVQQLDTQLRAMGATNLAKNLPGGIGRLFQTYDSVKDLRDSVREYRDSMAQPVREKWPEWKFGWDKPGGAKAGAGDTTPTGGTAEAPPGSAKEGGWTQIQGRVWVPPLTDWPPGADNISPSKDGKEWYYTSEKGDVLGVVPTRPQ